MIIVVYYYKIGVLRYMILPRDLRPNVCTDLLSTNAIGNSHTDKSHVALGLGLAACQRGMLVDRRQLVLPRIASKQMLLNFGRTRCPGRSSHEVGDS